MACSSRRIETVVGTAALLAGALFLAPHCVAAQGPKVVWSNQEKPIADKVDGLRQLPDEIRGGTTKQLAMQIRGLPVTPNKWLLAYELASLSTEGDFGHDTVQEAAATLAEALHEQPQPAEKGQPSGPYIELAQLVRYEHAQVSLDDPQFAAALAKMTADDERRAQIDFTLTDLQGKIWHLKDLKGQVVLINFWATWCPPCLKEIPDLQTLYKRFQSQGFVVLAISDESVEKVKPFVERHGMSYPVFVDPKRKVIDQFSIDGIPKSFVYDRSGKLAAESIDMRTQQQFLGMLAQAGLQ
jgi:peroxiredoxin